MSFGRVSIRFVGKNYLFVGVFLGALIIAGGIYIATTKPQSANIAGSKPTASASAEPAMEELKIEDEKIGTGDTAVAGKKVTVNYVGTLPDGTKFDSSYDRREPFTFNLGAGEVIKGWDEGVAGMKVGGKRKLTIPPSLGYGNADMGTIPPNSTLIFEVELLKVE